MSEVLLNVMAAALTAVITGAISIGMAWLQSKIKSEKVNHAVQRVGQATQAVVCELQQTTVNTLREANDGKLTDEQVAELKQTSLDKVKAILDEPAIELLNSVGVEFEQMVQTYVEKAVNENKAKNTTALPSADSSSSVASVTQS